VYRLLYNAMHGKNTQQTDSAVHSMKDAGYEAPSLTVLGSLRDLTLTFRGSVMEDE
jgi:hypothetical protein